MSGKPERLAKAARSWTGQTQTDFCARFGLSQTLQSRREDGSAKPTEIAERLYRTVIVICAVGRPELLDVVDQDGKRSEARSYLRLAEELQARGLSSLIPRTL